MYRLQYIALRISAFILLLFPERMRFKFAEFLGILSYYLIKKRRMIALANLQLAFPEKTDEERKKIAKQSYKIMAKAFLSTLWFEDYLDKNVELEDFQRLSSLKDEGKGVAVALIHMGNMEASLKVAKTYKSVTVSKAQRNPYVDRFITESRKKMDVILLKKSKHTSRELKKYIDEDYLLALFTDHRDKGASVVFFGEETVSPTGIVNIALKNNLSLIVAYNVMHPDNTCTTYFTNELDLVRTSSFKEDVRVNTQLVMSTIEGIIRSYPEQWLWFHDRWKLSKKFKK